MKSSEKEMQDRYRMTNTHTHSLTVKKRERKKNIIARQKRNNSRFCCYSSFCSECVYSIHSNWWYSRYKYYNAKIHNNKKEEGRKRKRKAKKKVENSNNKSDCYAFQRQRNEMYAFKRIQIHTCAGA